MSLDFTSALRRSEGVDCGEFWWRRVIKDINLYKSNTKTIPSVERERDARWEDRAVRRRVLEFVCDCDRKACASVVNKSSSSILSSILFKSIDEYECNISLRLLF